MTIHIGGVLLLDCTELGMDARGSRMSVRRLEFPRTTADCILCGGKMKTQHLQLLTPTALLPKQCS